MRRTEKSINDWLFVCVNRMLRAKQRKFREHFAKGAQSDCGKFFKSKAESHLRKLLGLLVGRDEKGNL